MVTSVRKGFLACPALAELPVCCTKKPGLMPLALLLNQQDNKTKQ